MVIRREWIVSYEIVNQYEEITEDSDIRVNETSKFAAKQRAKLLIDVPQGQYLNITQIKPSGASHDHL